MRIALNIHDGLVKKASKPIGIAEKTVLVRAGLEA
jgi:hypothetical protein